MRFHISACSNPQDLGMAYKSDDSEVITDGQITASAVITDNPSFTSNGARLNSPGGWVFSQTGLYLFQIL